MVFGLLREINLIYSYHWKGDADIRSMLGTLRAETEIARSRCNLRVSPYFEPTINFYRITKNIDWLEPVTRTVKNDVKYDYFYTVKNKKFSTENKRKVQDFTISNSELLKILRSDGCCPEAN